MKLRSCFLVLLLWVSFDAAAYEISFKSNYPGGYAYLTYYFGKNLNIEDSSLIDAEGKALFKKTRHYPGESTLLCMVKRDSAPIF